MAVTAKDFELNDEQLASCLSAYELLGRPGSDDVLQDDVDYSDDMILELYAAALAMGEDKRHEDCIAAFHFLTTLNPRIAVLWIGLGVAYMNHQDMPAAIKAYQRAIVAEPDNVAGYQYAAKCWLEQNDKNEALQIVQAGIDRADNAENPDDWADFKRELEELAKAVEDFQL